MLVVCYAEGNKKNQRTTGLSLNHFYDMISQNDICRSADSEQQVAVETEKNKYQVITDKFNAAFLIISIPSKVSL